MHFLNNVLRHGVANGKVAQAGIRCVLQRIVSKQEVVTTLLVRSLAVTWMLWTDPAVLGVGLVVTYGFVIEHVAVENSNTLHALNQDREVEVLVSQVVGKTPCEVWIRISERHTVVSVKCSTVVGVNDAETTRNVISKVWVGVYLLLRFPHTLGLISIILDKW